MYPFLCEKDLIVNYNEDNNSIEMRTIDLIKIFYRNLERVFLVL
jgi:hypothetical protein